MAECAASVTDDMQPQGRRSSFPFNLPNMSQQVVSSPESEVVKPALNLVLCGRRGAGKTSAAKAILGQTELHSVSSSSVCVKHQGEVCGRWVSLVELPALYGEPQEAVMEESFRCISLCDPEGVHAFILVLPVGPITDEDKGELETIQNTFSSQVNDFTMILFTVESDPTTPAVDDFVKENKDIQELYQSCGGRYVVLNIEDKQHISQMLDIVENMRVEGSRCFTKDMFTKAQMQKVTRLKAELQNAPQTNDDDNQSRESLRMVLIGKAGSGKGSTANTILDKKCFKPRICPKPLKTTCEEARGEIDGRPIVLVTTPDSFDKTLVNDEVQQEFRQCISMLAPGPHVFLLVLQIGIFSEKDKDSVELIKRVFGEKSRDFTIIIFTRGEELDDQSFESYIADCDDFVKQLIKECGGRYQVFNNKDHTNRTQVRELLTKIENMLKENGYPFYTTEMVLETVIKQKVEEVVKQKDEEMQRQKKELEQIHNKQMEECRKEMKKEREAWERERKNYKEKMTKSWRR